MTTSQKLCTKSHLLVTGSPELRRIAERELAELHNRLSSDESNSTESCSHTAISTNASTNRTSSQTSMDSLLTKIEAMKKRDLSNYLEVCLLRLTVSKGGEMQETMDKSRAMIETLTALIR
jgi:hypothetical protein